MEQSSKRDAMVTLAVLLVIVVIVVGAVVFTKKKNDNAATNQSSNSTSTESSVSPQGTTLSQENNSGPTQDSSRGAYKDGTYSATGQYSTPDGPETITVNVTLKDGSVTSTTANGSMKSLESREYVTAFLEGYKSVVVGKRIDGLSLSRVSGSSLTPQGFNRAIEQIRNQAQF